MSDSEVDLEAFELAEIAARIEKISSQYNLPPLEAEQEKELALRIAKIPGYVADIDMRMLVRMFCREKKCLPTGPIIQ